MYVNENENYVTYQKYRCQSTKQLIKKELLCTLVFNSEKFFEQQQKKHEQIKMKTLWNQIDAQQIFLRDSI